MHHSITARAPGKIILSGEHAVVYGQPALAMAVNRYVFTTITTQSPSEVLFELLNLKYKKAHSLDRLRKMKLRLEEAYLAFQRGDKGIRDVLKKPFELLQYTATNLVDRLNLSVSKGIKIYTESTIPIGCGMGSSAATIVSTNHALGHFYHQPLLMEQHLDLGLDAENLQHGNSSGLDLQLAIQGGCLFYWRGELESRVAPHFPFRIINSGSPESTTGECVRHAAAFFTPHLLSQFATVSFALDNAIQDNTLEAILETIQLNHRLLVEIGVVPHRIQSFINEVEQRGLAAKICGAGAVQGDKAGIILIAGNGNIDDLLDKYQYSLEDIHYEAEGVKIV